MDAFLTFTMLLRHSGHMDYDLYGQKWVQNGREGEGLSNINFGDIRSYKARILPRNGNGVTWEHYSIV